MISRSQSMNQLTPLTMFGRWVTCTLYCVVQNFPTLSDTLLAYICKTSTDHVRINCPQYMNYPLNVVMIRIVDCGLLSGFQAVMNHGFTILSVGVQNLVDFHLPSTITMPPYTHWVHPSFHNVLTKHCNEYLKTSDCGNDKTHTKLVTWVSKDIIEIAKREKEILPDDLEKVISQPVGRFITHSGYSQSVCTWFGNYASGKATEDRPGKLRLDTHGHLASSRSWTTKSVCGFVFVDCISDQQKSLSDGPDKDIRKYWAVLGSVFESLNEVELKKCEDMAEWWNTMPLPDDVQWTVLVVSVHYWCLWRLSKGIPTDFTDFLKYLNHQTRAVFIAFTAYTNKDGEQTYVRWDSNGLPRYICSNLCLDMRQMESIFAKHNRSISKALITSSTCGKSSTLVRSHLII